MITFKDINVWEESAILYYSSKKNTRILMGLHLLLELISLNNKNIKIYIRRYIRAWTIRGYCIIVQGTYLFCTGAVPLPTLDDLTPYKLNQKVERLISFSSEKNSYEFLCLRDWFFFFFKSESPSHDTPSLPKN